MNVTELLNRLHECGVRLKAESDELIVQAPREALGPELRASLVKHKQEIIRTLGRRGGERPEPRLPQLTPDPQRRHEPFTLTDIQQVYWLGRTPSLELGEVGIHLYEELDCVNLNLERLSRAWQQVIDRHEMLRAVVLPDGRQRILERASYCIQTLDLRGSPPPEQAATLASVRARLSHRVYSPETWPLFEIMACRLDERRTRLHVSIDALHVDMGSFAIIFKDWAYFYANPTSPLPPLELAFRDYALALDTVRGTEHYERSLRYWRQRAAQLPPPPQLPQARSPASLTAQKFTRRRGGLGAGDWRRLKERGARAGLTASGVTLAAYAELLAAWGASAQFTVNVTLFNRLPLHPQVNEIAGDFTSMILLGCDASKGDTFADRAAEIQRQLFEGIKNRYVSGVEVLREVARLRGQEAGRLIMPVVYTSTLNLRTQGLRPLKTFGERVYNIMQTPQVSLDLQVYEEDGALVFNWDAVEGLYPPGVTADMFVAYARLLSDLARQEGAWRGKARQWVPAYQIRRREAINATESPVPDETLDGLFAAAALQGPRRPALITPGRVLDYGELSRRCSRLSRRLRALGAGGGRPVAVVMEKGPEQALGTLAILQAGAAYMPLDPRLPRERFRYMLENGGVSLALTCAASGEGLDWPEGVRRLDVDGDDCAGTDDERAPQPCRRARDLAYVLYTSGSTGQPKGVMVEHRSVVNRILDVNRRFGVGPEDRVLALTALHHDLSVYDLFGLLAAGGGIVLPDPSRIRDPAHWAELISRERVTIWNTVPAFMEIMVAHLERAPERPSPLLGSLRLVLLSGDTVPLTLPDRVRALAEKARVVSLGGPTETTIWDICYPVAAVGPDWRRLPYGRPMANAKYYVMDEALRPRPDWVPGELCICGVGLARGYWRDEEKTRAAFVSHPLTGERLYRSGDIGRHLPDGNIEILGRKDFQIKLRGHRIEASEVENAIKRHPAVSSVVVTASGEGLDKYLVAYVVPRRDSGGAEAPGAAPRRAEGQYGPRRTSLDEAEQIEFKLARRGLRADLQGHERLRLDGPEAGDTLTETYTRRRSQRSFTREPVAFKRFGELLSCLRGLHVEGAPLPKHRYPSAGALYPVQTYLHVKPGRAEGVPGGIYYYHPAEHALVRLSADDIPRTVHVTENHGVFEDSAFSIFLVGSLGAVQPLYGDLAESFCLLEAGHIGQLLMTEAPANGLGLCPVGDLDSTALLKLLGLSPQYLYLYSLFGGPISPQPQGGPGSPCGDATRLAGRGPLADELRRLLEGVLPEHMIPSAFVLLDALPLTPSGKLDRAALSTPGVASLVREGAFEEPATETERVVLNALREILRRDEVGVGDRFSALGANSMHMVQLSFRLGELLNREVPVAEMFRHPNARALAAYLSSGRDDSLALGASASRAEKRKNSAARRRVRP